MYDNKNNSANVPNGSSMAYLLFVANDNNMMNIKYITPPLLKTIIFFSLLTVSYTHLTLPTTSRV